MNQDDLLALGNPFWGQTDAYGNYAFNHAQAASYNRALGQFILGNAQNLYGLNSGAQYIPETDAGRVIREIEELRAKYAKRRLERT